jgi:GNAT superfamily N-acetyltransferase
VKIDHQGAFVYQVLEDDHATQAIMCLCNVFSAQEPLGKAIGISPDELAPFVTDLVQYAIKTNLSWIAIDKMSSRVVGVRILTDFHNDFTPGSYKGEKLNAIFNFLENLYTVQTHDEQDKIKPLLHCWMVAVLPEFQRQGILRNLYRAGKLRALKKGYRFGIEEVTSKHNLAFLESEVSVKKINTIYYAQYQDSGAFPFLFSVDTKACVLCQYPLEIGN